MTDVCKIIFNGYIMADVIKICKDNAFFFAVEAKYLNFLISALLNNGHGVIIQSRKFKEIDLCFLLW